ncbi:MAG: DUF3313 domain-containing protein [Lentisphaeraceae bacterium]|nr:DUF3313 domain-containing protein [Lentisphaeraceae bacterium]
MLKNLVMIVCSLFLASCFTTEQARDTDAPSGFLKDYSQLQEGGDDEALRTYTKKSVDWKKYNKIILDPIEIWASKESDTKDLSKKELDNLMSLLNGVVKQEVGKSFKVVSTPGPDTLRLKIALTDGESSEPITDTLSSVIPITLALSYLKKVATGRHLSVGKASVEAELVDSASGERLAAAMDSRYGGKGGIEGKFSSWDDVQEAFEFWAQRFTRKMVARQK